MSGLRFQTPDRYPARPTRVAVELRDGDRTVARSTSNVDDGVVRFPPQRADSIVISVLKSSDLININALGFAEDAPVGVSEVQVLPGGANPAPTTIARSRSAATPTRSVPTDSGCRCRVE